MNLVLLVFVYFNCSFIVNIFTVKINYEKKIMKKEARVELEYSI